MSSSQNSSSPLSIQSVDISQSLSLGNREIDNSINNVDRISNLPNDILLKIVSRLSMEEIIKTSVLSKKWLHLWKNISFLFFDMRNIININGMVLPSLLDRGATLITKIINNHNGHLESSLIFHYAHQCVDGTLKSWIQSLIDEKQTKILILGNFCSSIPPKLEDNVLNLPPKTFSHPNLKTLSLFQYLIKDPLVFKSCWNLKRLELLFIMAEVDVFNKVLSFCPSLEVLLLHLVFTNPSGHLKINLNNLKVLSILCNEIDGIEVFATNLDILTIEFTLCESDKVVLKVPRLRFGRNYWVVGTLCPHTSYNISCLGQEEKDNESEHMALWPRNYVKTPASLSVNVDLKNPKEIEILGEILAAWDVKMIELEILFKNNKPLEEDGEPINDGAQNNLWDDAKPFPNADFRVDTVWMYNFNGSEEEFEFASVLVKQNTIMKTMMIKTSSFDEEKKLEIEVAIARLKNLPQGNEELSIESF